MKNFKHALAVSALVLASTSAMAGWSVGGGYTNLSDSADGVDLSLGVLSANVGYSFESASSDWSVMPELRVGTGIQDDIVYDAGVEVERLIVLSTRFNYQATDAVSFFIQPSYANLKVKASYMGMSATDDEWEFGVGGGSNFKLSDQWSLEALYESYDGSNAISFAARYSF